ncbi:MAG: hypothetical protein WD401_00330 [Thermomicrobiaceae bacterium]
MIRDRQQQPRSPRRVCPCYRLPQLAPGTALTGRARLPVCTALDEIAHINHEKAARLCRSGAFPTCDRFISAYPDWQPTTPVANPASAPSTTEFSISRQLLSSAAWVIGIPTAITLMIILAIWITENVWMPTQIFNLTLLG